MNNRPQTLYALADSPIGLAAWMIDHDDRSQKMIARAFAGQSRGPVEGRRARQRHALLADQHRDLVGAALLGQRAPSGRPGGFFDARGIKIPVAVSAFPDEIYTAPKSWAEKAYPKLIHYNKAAQGRPLRGLGAAGVLRRGDARVVQVTALGGRMRAMLVAAFAALLAAPASAQQLAPVRNDLQRHDFSIAGWETIQTRVDFAPGSVAPPHKHPGEEIIYVLKGTLEYTVAGKPRQTLKMGDVLFIPYGVVHSARNAGTELASELATYVVEKGKPLVVPVK